MENLPEEEQLYMKDVFDEVEFKDKMRDHSIDSLTPEEHNEIALFHSYKQDPFFKHHLRTFLARQSENLSNTAITGLHGPEENDPDDFTKFDRINIFDFRRTLPRIERESKLDGMGRSFGSGRRKRSRATVSVMAGSGKVTINGKPMIEYFMIPSQRHRILMPLSATHYTCLLDVDIKVKGGGLTG